MKKSKLLIFNLFREYFSDANEELKDIKNNFSNENNYNNIIKINLDDVNENIKAQDFHVSDIEESDLNIKVIKII